jgi:serine/threonine protein kinase/tetratricopeptide (TPR) repeat protein
MTTQTLHTSEIEYGRLAIERRLVTREQVRECADLRAAGSADHLAKVLVNKGYIDPNAARQLLTEVQSRLANPGSGTFPRPSQSGYAAAPGSGAYPAPSASHRGAAPTATGFGSAPNGAMALTCPACGSRVAAYAEQAGQRVRCPGCAGPVDVPRGMSGTHSGQAPATFRTQVVDPQPRQGAYGYDSGVAPTNPGSGSGHFAAPPIQGPGGTHRQGGGAFALQDANRGYMQGMTPGSGAPPQMGSGAPGYGNFEAVKEGFDPNGFQGELPQNLAADDPIAHAMSVRTNADGSVETVFGPYDIIGEIARGGMGIVYRARQRSLKRIVALKVMKEGENASEKQIRRFKRETEAAAKLQHPNIVAVHEVGCHEGFHYFTMDLIEGEPLDAICKRGEKMPVERVLSIVKEVAHAIHYAHGKGIIHRDLKPANILLDTDGHPKVTDFGLAKNIDHKSMLTRTGAVVGTPFYMPPEQARGDIDIDRRADVYALGVILYELLTLKLPFHGETTMEVYHKILEEEPVPPRKHDSRLNADVNTIILKSMEKDMGRRYQTSAELAEDIERYLNGDPIKARPLGPIGRAIKRARKNLPVVVVGGVTALALMSGAGLFYWRWKKTREFELELNRRHEWETFVTEVGNQKIGAKSQIASGVARRRDRDPDGALVDLQESVRILDDLPLLTRDFTSWNTTEALDQYLKDEQAEVSSIYRDTYLEQGRAHVDKGDPESLVTALGSFQKGLEYDAGSADVMLEIGRVEALQGKFDQALKTFKGILDKDPAHVDARLEMGRVHDRAGDYPKALDCYTHVIERATKPYRAYLLRGQTWHTLGKFEEAQQDFQKVVDTKDDHFDGYIWLGRAHQALGHNGEAQEALTEAIDLNPSLPDGYYYRAELYAAQRKHAEAIKDYEVAISRSAQYHRAYLGLGEALEWVLDYDRARQQYDEVLRATDREAAAVAPEAHAALAELLLVQSDPLECTQDSEERLRQETASADGAMGAQPPLDRLKADTDRLRAERVRGASEGFTRALELQPRLVPALLGRARLLLGQGELDRARADLEGALAALAQRPSVRFQGLGGAASRPAPEEEEDEEEGWDDEPDIAGDEAKPGDVALADAHAMLGLLALRRDAMKEAQDSFKHALEASPTCSLAVAGLGHVALKAGDKVKSVEHFVRARELDTEGKDEAHFFFQEGVRYQGLASRSKKPEYFKQARQCFSRAVCKNPLDAMADLERARLCAEWGSWDPAVRLATRAIESDPFLREGYERLGFLFARDLPTERDAATGRPENLRDPALAEKHFDKAIEVAGDGVEESSDAYFGRALARLGGDVTKAADERLVPARDDLLMAIRAIPTDFRAAEPRRISQSIAYLELLGAVQERLGDQDAAVAARARVDDVRKAAREAARQELKDGQVLRDRLNYSDAIKHFDKAIELDPEYSDAYYERGTCYLKIGNFVPGILDFSRALELNPRIADQVYNKVYQISYVVDLNRVITELNKIVSDHPSVSYVIFLRGFFYVAKTEFKKFERSDLDLGIADFNRTLELNPTHVTALLYRGFLYYKMATLETEQESKQACYDRAMGDYKAALVLDPVSGISHYLQALSWSVMSTEEGISPEEVIVRKKRSIEELQISFSCEFKGYERIKNEKGFDAVRQEPAFIELMRGK